MQPLEVTLKRYLFRLINAFRSGKQYAPSELPIDSFERILIIRQHDQLGDLLIATPAVRALRRKFPNAFIAIVVREYTAPVVQNNPYVDEIIVFYEKLWRWNVHKVITFWNEVRNDFDCTIGTEHNFSLILVRHDRSLERSEIYRGSRPSFARPVTSRQDL